MIDDEFHNLTPFLRVKLAVDDADLMGLLASGAPTDEYDSESKALLERLPSISTHVEYTQAITDVFTRFFGPTFRSDPVRLAALGRLLWRRFHGETASSVEGAQLLAIARRAEGEILRTVLRTPSGGLEEAGLRQVGLIDGATEIADLIEHNELGVALEHLVYMVTETRTVLDDADRRFVNEACRRLGLRDLERAEDVR